MSGLTSKHMMQRPHNTFANVKYIWANMRLIWRETNNVDYLGNATYEKRLIPDGAKLWCIIIANRGSPSIHPPPHLTFATAQRGWCVYSLFSQAMPAMSMPTGAGEQRSLFSFTVCIHMGYIQRGFMVEFSACCEHPQSPKY